MAKLLQSWLAGETVNWRTIIYWWEGWTGSSVKYNGPVVFGSKKKDPLETAEKGIYVLYWRKTN